MKSTRITVSLSALMIAVFCFGSLGAAAAPTVNVITDPRIELLSVVQHFSDYTGYEGKSVHTSLDFPYRTAAIEYFTPWKDHKAVKLFDEMSAKGFWYGQPPEAMLSFSNPPELKQTYPISDFIYMRAGGKEKLEEFIEALRDFAVKSNFNEFYASHEKDYDAMVTDYIASVGSFDAVKDLSEYYGYSQKSYTVVVAPFFLMGAFGPSIPEKNGTMNVYNIGGPWGYENGRFFFGDKQYFRRLVWHEFSHSYVNHQVDKYMDRLIGPGDTLNPGMKEKIDAMPNVGFDVFVHEWVSEHIVRAVTSFLTYTKIGEAEGDEAIAREVRDGFPLVKILCDKLEDYNENRAEYKTFTDFFPEMVEVFEKLDADQKS